MPSAPIAITTGEPAGIGPDICVMLAQQPQSARLVAIGDPDLLHARAKLLGLPLQLRVYDSQSVNNSQEVNDKSQQQRFEPGRLLLKPVSLRATVTPGVASVKNAAYVLETLEQAVRGCQAGDYAAMVTAPVHKGVINDAGIPFSGHTEYLAELTQTPQVVMMLASDKMRVALATTHLPLAEVARAVSKELLLGLIPILHRDLIHKFGCRNPKILVCGLNPHAGEGGHLGREEIDIIIPVLEELRESGLDLVGPLPADTLFTPKHLDAADAVLAMYHDQGLPVLKYQSFGAGVNITLGLPIIRTSVDHGTAFDLAGSGRANPGSLQKAVDYALHMAEKSSQQTP